MQLKLAGKFQLKLNIGQRPIAKKYGDGKMKRTLKRELKVPEIVKREVIGTNHLLPGVQSICGGALTLASARGSMCSPTCWMFWRDNADVLEHCLVSQRGLGASENGMREVASELRLAAVRSRYNLVQIRCPSDRGKFIFLKQGALHWARYVSVLWVLSGVRTVSAVRVSGGAHRGGNPSVPLFTTLTKWFQFPRLETRTKESNTYASIWVHILNKTPDA